MPIDDALTLLRFSPRTAARDIAKLIDSAAANADYAAPSPELIKQVEGIEAVCARHGVTLQAAAIQFTLGHPAVASVIPGARSASHVQRTVEAFKMPIPADFWAELKHEKLIREDAPVPA